MNIIREDARGSNMMCGGTLINIDENGYKGYSYMQSHTKEAGRAFEAHSKDKDSFYSKKCKKDELCHITCRLMRICRFQSPVFIPEKKHIIRFPCLVCFHQCHRCICSSIGSGCLYEICFSGRIGIQKICNRKLIKPTVAALSTLCQIALGNSVFLQIRFLISLPVYPVSQRSASRLEQLAAETAKMLFSLISGKEEPCSKVYDGGTLSVGNPHQVADRAAVKYLPLLPQLSSEPSFQGKALNGTAKAANCTTTVIVSCLPGSPLPSSSFNALAVFFPITRLNSLRI